MAAAIQAKHDTVYDVGSQQVGRVYAEALLNAASKQGKAEAMLEQLDSLVLDVFAASPDFERFLASAAVRRHAKRQAIESAFGGKADPIFENFLLVLNDNDRLNAIRPIWSNYRDLYDAKQRRMRVKIRTAAPMTPAQEERLKTGLRDAFQREPIFEVRIDPDLLGGLYIQVGDLVFDGSVRSRLDRLRNQLMVSSSHEIQSQRNRFGA
jgi:F-type H+-transporting ATPase subunit delta